jgi:hypothetical protein
MGIGCFNHNGKHQNSQIFLTITISGFILKLSRHNLAMFYFVEEEIFFFAKVQTENHRLCPVKLGNYPR